MGRAEEDPLSPFEDLLNRFLDEENDVPLQGRTRPYQRYERQRLVERKYGWDQQSSFTLRCPRCRNDSLLVDFCERCQHVGIVGVVTVKPDGGYL